jgi:hypothetical protein
MNNQDTMDGQEILKIEELEAKKAPGGVHAGPLTIAWDE